MSGQPCTIARFLSLVDGAWRNALFVEPCGQSVCRLGAPCQGYLFTADETGNPVLIPADVFQRATCEPLDPTECNGRIQRSALESMYRSRLLWQYETAPVCVAHRLASQISLPCMSENLPPSDPITSGGDNP